jgi:hypothetical protein
MQFALICIGSIVVLGIIAALASMLTKGGTDEPIVEAHDCASCSSKASGDCKIACLMEEKKKRESNKS